MAKSESNSPLHAQLTPMMTGDTAPLDTQRIRATIARALMERPVLPRPEEVQEITGTLHRDVKVLAKEVEERRDEHRWHSTGWYEWHAVLGRAHEDLRRGPGAGLRSAVMHMQELGRTAEHILNCLDQ
ncbi:DUF6415 family natural product biosynthesis protein [Streptomyces sp. NPDC051173]|uniref:DUF6415 family natural product biosynthesis protein n=1 Tax=Streptomyces sp. NPDC051173 TaxID=3155164 RepID=UPI00344B90E0